jgi:hypothetical protein
VLGTSVAVSNDGLSVEYTDNGNETVLVPTMTPASTMLQTIYYFEAKICGIGNSRALTVGLVPSRSAKQKAIG